MERWKSGAGRWTYTEVREDRNKCVASDRSMTEVKGWTEGWEMSL